MSKTLFDLNGKTAIVTGGGKGIGRAVSLVLARQGAEVVILDIDDESGKETISQIVDTGIKARFIHCDVSDYEAVGGTFAEVKSLDILVNNAGIAHIGSVETTTPEDMDRIYQVNIKSVYNCLHHGVKR